MALERQGHPSHRLRTHSASARHLWLSYLADFALKVNKTIFAQCLAQLRMVYKISWESSYFYECSLSSSEDRDRRVGKAALRCKRIDQQPAKSVREDLQSQVPSFYAKRLVT